jgi:DNA gyrase inhibitor GyrI
MATFQCPYLGGDVELTEERLAHIAQEHPELVPDHLDLIASTLNDPDRVVRSRRMTNARLFSRWYNEIRGGKYAVVVVVTDSTDVDRHWVITAYLARTLVIGEVEWSKT